MAGSTGPDVAQPYDQFLLFGDSITQMSSNQEIGFGFQPALQEDQFRDNLKSIIQHPATQAQNPRIMILTPPPVNEYQLEKFDADKNTAHPSRTASLTKLYAEAAQEVGTSLGVPVVDVWAAFMASAGWKEGQPLIGSRDVPDLEEFNCLFTDGE
ncbi:hypothetical protein N7512_001560 [Penicillium capsulatum]|nr:hypothetical protein N7512_001560 [Penicillium capsulatum]